MSNISLCKTENNASASTLLRPRAFYTPLLDFLLLGGGSLFILPLIAMFPESRLPMFITVGFWLSFVVNYPHFAHSYQIFYRDFRQKLFSTQYPAHLRYRYGFAGLGVPLILLISFWACYQSGNPQLMGGCASVMLFFVGWHYVKQGYGMLIVESVYHRSFFNKQEKLTFRINAYCGWIFFFLLTLKEIGDKDFIGLNYYVIEFPALILLVSGVALVLSTIAALNSAVSATRRNGIEKLPFNGFVAYFVTIYIWICTVFTPAVLVVVPAFHSLQYLAIVWKYEYNRSAHELQVSASRHSPDTLWIRYATFIVLGMVLGGGTLWVLPIMLDTHVAFDKSLFGEHVFTFMVYIFVNIHHYFLDNVIWRKDNPEISKHLFNAA